MKRKTFVMIGLMIFLSFPSRTLFAQTDPKPDEHGHTHKEKTDGHDHADEHETEKTDEHGHGDEHAHGDEHENDEHGHGEGGHSHGEKDEHGEGGHGEEEESVGGVGKGNAVTAADEHTGIQLSEKAVKAISLKTEPYSGTAVPASALVHHQNQTGIYRLRGGWYKLIPVQVQKSENGQLLIQTQELKTGDAIVTSGVGLLRIAELDAFSGEVGHSH